MPNSRLPAIVPARWKMPAACCLILFCSSVCGIAQSPTPVDPVPARELAAAREIAPAREGTLAGEALAYAVEWRLISAGEAKLVWNPKPGSPAGAGDVKLHLESMGLVSRLFRVNDEYTATLGPDFCVSDTLLNAHEGSRRRETRVTYDPQRHQADYLEKDLNKNTTVAHAVTIPGCVHDVIGALMVLRTLKLEPGKTARIPVSDGKKFADVRIEAQNRESLKTAFGTLRTVRYEVFIFDNVIYKRTGRLHIWISDDERRLPVQLQVRLQFAIGTITLRLQKQEKT